MFTKRITSAFLAMVMMLVLCTPLSSAHSDSEYEFVPPDLAEGEVWVPASGVATRSFGDECPLGCDPGDDFEYQGYITGDETLEAILRGITWTLIGAIPGFGTLSFVLSVSEGSAALINYLENNGEVPAKYYQYIYHRNRDNTLWYHIVYVEDFSGDEEYLGCKIRWANSGIPK